MPSIPRGSMSIVGRSTRKLSAALVTLRTVVELLEQLTATTHSAELSSCC
jgi:hypothetical protein